MRKGNTSRLQVDLAVEGEANYDIRWVSVHAGFLLKLEVLGRICHLDALRKADTWASNGPNLEKLDWRSLEALKVLHHNDPLDLRRPLCACAHRYRTLGSAHGPLKFPNGPAWTRAAGSLGRSQHQTTGIEAER